MHWFEVIGKVLQDLRLVVKFSIHRRLRLIFSSPLIVPLPSNPLEPDRKGDNIEWNTTSLTDPELSCHCRGTVARALSYELLVNCDGGRIKEVLSAKRYKCEGLHERTDYVGNEVQIVVHW